MKRITLWMALLVLCCVPALAGDAPNAPASNGSLSSNTGEEGSTCTFRTADEIMQEWRETSSPERHPIPSCPPESNTCTGNTTRCGGNNPCGVDGPTTLADTGFQSCQRDDGSVLQCKVGLSVHVKSKACAQCDCCSTVPACVCPNDCGEIAELSCR